MTGEYLGTCCACHTGMVNGPGLVRCSGCNSVHHADCWNRMMGCAVPGCPQQHNVALHTATPQQYAQAPQQALVQPPPVLFQQPQPIDPRQFGSPSQPPASESSWNPVIGGVLAGFAIIAATLVTYLVLNDSSQASRPVPQAVPVTSYHAPRNRQEDVAQQIETAISESAQGRILVRAGEWQAVMNNRIETLDRVESISGARGSVVRAQNQLRQALSASLDADRAHVALNSDDVPQDAAATAAKVRFVAIWNPIARRYGLTSYSPEDI